MNEKKIIYYKKFNNWKKIYLMNFYNLKNQDINFRKTIIKNLSFLLKKGQFIMGKEVYLLEKKLSKFVG